VFALALALVVSLGVVEPWMVLALAFGFGIVNAFDLPARQSFLVDLVGKDDLSNAIALNSAAFNTARVLGPALAGVLLAAFGEAACFWANAVSYLAVIYSLATLGIPVRAHEKTSLAETLARVGEGVGYAWTSVPIRNLLVLLALSAGLGFQYSTLLPVYAREILHAGPEAYGLMVSAFGVGSLLSAIVMMRRFDRWGLRRNLLIGLVVAGIGMGVFAWSRVLPLTMAMGFASGFGLILYVATTNTMIQLRVEDRFRGRVMSLYTLMFIGTAPAGSFVLGSIAEHFGAPAATLLSGVTCAAGATWVFLRLRAIARQEAAATPPAPAPA
jgi:MFS family permease